MIKKKIMITVFALISCQPVDRKPQSIDSEAVMGYDPYTTVDMETPDSLKSINSCLKGDSTNFASNKSVSIKGKTYPADTHFTITSTDEGIEIMAHLEDGSGAEKDSMGSYDIIATENFPLSCDDLTPIPISEDANGELVLGEYSLPMDFQSATTKGVQPKVRKKKGGVTYCYREVKKRVKKKVILTGGSAYMAAPQLEQAGFLKISSYEKAPNGAICVFGAGGKRTSSGGHKHGHIGIKGESGVIDPKHGFKLKRPFIGCYVDRSRH